MQLARIFAMAFYVLCAASSAQTLSAQQLTAVRAGACLDVASGAPAMNAGNPTALRDWLNSASSFVVWRTNVQRAEIYHQTSSEGTTWNWTTYKNQSQTEQGAWVQMFMGDQADFSLPNLRAGVSAIFTGSAQANAQRDHVLAIARRAATHVERVLGTGTGTLPAPGLLTFQGSVSINQATALVFRDNGALWGC